MLGVEAVEAHEVVPLIAARTNRGMILDARHVESA
jgi:hypothetical protein